MSGCARSSTTAHNTRRHSRLRAVLLTLLAVMTLVLGAVAVGMASAAPAVAANVVPLAPGARPAASVPGAVLAAPTPGADAEQNAAADAAAQAAAAAAASPSVSPTPGGAAAPSSSTSGGADAGMLAGLDTADTHGLSVAKYQLSVDDGGVTSPVKAVVNGVLLAGGWSLYAWTVGAATKLIDVGLQMEWISWLVELIDPIATSVQTSVIDRLGLHQLAMTLAAVYVAWNFARGRFARGFSQLVMSSLVAALAATVLANPVQTVTGDGGLLIGFRDFGQATATVVVTDGRSSTPDPDQIQKATSGALIDTFVRMPHQMINYGRVLDGGPCQGAYDEALKAGPYASDDDSARSAVGGCDEDLKKWADDPGWNGVVSLAALAPAGGFLMLLAVLIVVLLFLASLQVVFTALKLIVDLITAQLPGERAGLWGSIGSLIGSLLLMGLMSVVLAIYCLLLQGVLGDDDGGGAINRFLFVDVLLISLIILAWKMRKRLAERGQRWTRKIAAQTGGQPAQPVRMPSVSQVRGQLAQVAATRSSLGRRTAAGSGQAAATGGAVQRVAARVAQSRTAKLAVGAATLASGGTALALKSTIGAPVYGPRAARAVKAAAQARSTAMKTRLGKARADAGAFKDEYVGNLATAGRGAATAGRGAGRGASATAKAAGRKAAPTVTAASIHLSTPDVGDRGSAQPRASTGMSAPKAAHRAGTPTPTTVAAQARRRAQQRDTARATSIPTPPRTPPATRSSSDVASPPVTQSPSERLRARVDRRDRGKSA